MATIFDFLQDIISKKKGNLLDDIDNEIIFQPYMVSRWLSMFSTKSHSLINATTNRLYPIFNRKKDWYKMFLILIPKERFHKIFYIRKTKEKVSKESVENDKVIEFLAKNQQISKREIKMYIEMSNLDLKDLKRNI